ncbi:flagellar hook-basal body complex protein FliE [Novosphingobium profundi]|uniref:flagellar hook-basal body complex protein FliE n=1 Tax=Novosphingobium profundi TaxID=1774954 RepID=UPI001BDAC9EE|nr:flagellar hook-basal body complex protein FliE [Novosphingobium profundi]MBT0670423.1 flagellar hook-basal body complex protein FliE [Novosphingobium profundi]
MSTVPAVLARDGGIQQILDMRQQIIARSEILRQIHAPDTSAAAGAALAGSPVGNGSPAPAFAETLRSALDGVNAVQARAETLSSAYQTGEVTDVAKVMLARQEAGVAFEATMQVRNKLLSAYQDIMRMGV